MSADKRDPAERATAGLTAGCGGRAAQHPPTATSHRLDPSDQPGVTMQGATSPSISKQTHTSYEWIFFFPQTSVNPAWKKSWSLPICSLGKDLNLMFSYVYRQTGHWRGKLNGLQRPIVGRSQLKSLGFRHLFSLEVMNRSTSCISHS